MSPILLGLVVKYCRARLASDELSTGFSVDPGPGDQTVRAV
jgi:hypothetical protein